VPTTEAAETCTSRPLADVDKLLAVRIRRDSLFDINKHREETAQV